jgi:hypothetical protein
MSILFYKYYKDLTLFKTKVGYNLKGRSILFNKFFVKKPSKFLFTNNSPSKLNYRWGTFPLKKTPYFKNFTMFTVNSLNFNLKVNSTVSSRIGPRVGWYKRYNFFYEIRGNMPKIITTFFFNKKPKCTQRAPWLYIFKRKNSKFRVNHKKVTFQRYFTILNVWAAHYKKKNNRKFKKHLFFKKKCLSYIRKKKSLLKFLSKKKRFFYSKLRLLLARNKVFSSSLRALRFTQKKL